MYRFLGFPFCGVALIFREYEAKQAAKAADVKGLRKKKRLGGGGGMTGTRAKALMTRCAAFLLVQFCHIPGETKSAFCLVFFLSFSQFLIYIYFGERLLPQIPTFLQMLQYLLHNSCNFRVSI